MRSEIKRLVFTSHVSHSRVQSVPKYHSPSSNYLPGKNKGLRNERLAPSSFIFYKRKHWVRSWCKTCVLRQLILTRHVTIFFFFSAKTLCLKPLSLSLFSPHLISPSLNQTHNLHGQSFKAQHKPLVSRPKFKPPLATTTNHSSKKTSIVTPFPLPLLNNPSTTTMPLTHQ